MTKLRLTWLGIVLLVLAVGCVVGALVGGPVAARIAIGMLGLVAAPVAWRCLTVAARRPDESWPPVPRPWER